MPYAFSSDGVRIHYTTIGSGPPLLLIHGLTGSSQMWDDRGYVDPLKDEFQLILIDLRGHGESEKLHDRAAYHLPRQADDVVAVLDDLQIAGAHFCGFSLGVRVGFHLGARYPDRVRSLILWGGHPYPETPADIEACHSIIATLRNGMEAWVTRIGATGARRQILLEADADALIAATYGEMADPGVADSLSHMTMPCLMIVGGLDGANDMARQAAKELPRADYVSVGQYGHSLWRSDVMLPYAQAFLKRLDSGTFDI